MSYSIEIHSFCCLLRQVDPYSFPKRLVHRGWFVTWFFHFQNIPFSLSSSGICLLLLLLRPHPPSVFPSVKCIIRRYLRNMWLMYLAFLFLIFRRIFLPDVPCAALLHFSCQRPKWPFPSISNTTIRNFSSVSHLFPKWPSYSPTQHCVPTVALDQFILKNNFSLLVGGASVFLNATYVMAVLEWISRWKQKYCTYNNLIVSKQ